MFQALSLSGIHSLQGFLSPGQQRDLVAEIRAIPSGTAEPNAAHSPLFAPTMRGGVPFRYAMTNCGELGWIALNGQYAYTSTHPVTGKPWAAMPDSLRASARQLTTQFGEPDYQPQSCLVNVYQGTAQSLGLHQDKSEQRSDRMIISLSLGASGFFVLGGRQKTDPKTQLLLQSGDVLILAGESRLGWHGFQG